ncbi:MAG TPA: hypothetical protein VFC19_41375 [Candidatus Limnocylindrales bacterium]|nr:hypothetical protein [Candidatus Limnocylindrales bacterium]
MAGTPLIVVARQEEAAHLDGRYPVLVTGIGEVAAAVAVTRALATGDRPSEIINLGTAGALRAGLAGTQEIKSVIQHDFDSPAIEAATLRAEGLAQRADLVDMEGYAVAAAATAFGVPVRIIKHVSDHADNGAFKSWQATVNECARALAVFLHVS